MAKIPLMRIPIPLIWTWFVGLFMEMVHFFKRFSCGNIVPQERTEYISPQKSARHWFVTGTCIPKRNHSQYHKASRPPFLAATKQLYEWFSPSVRLSVCPSVCPSVTPFWLCSHHRTIMTFSGVITSDRSDVHAKGRGQRSKVKVTEVTTQLNRFRTVTPVWIHVWRWNNA